MPLRLDDLLCNQDENFEKNEPFRNGMVFLKVRPDESTVPSFFG